MAVELDSRHQLLPKTGWENEDLNLIVMSVFFSFKIMYVSLGDVASKCTSWCTNSSNYRSPKILVIVRSSCPLNRGDNCIYTYIYLWWTKKIHSHTMIIEKILSIRISRLFAQQIMHGENYVIFIVLCMKGNPFVRLKEK